MFELKYVLIVSFVLLTLNVDGSFGDEGIIDKLKSGFKLAGRLLGLDRVAGVSQLVSESFASNKEHVGGDDKSGNIFSSFLRILGFDAKKIGAMAVNTIIFIAQLISSSLGKTSPPQALPDERAREIKEGNPFEWLSNNTRLIDVIHHVQKKNLSEYVIEYIKENSVDEETDCVQLLICKLSPFVNRMQESLQQNEEDVRGKDLLLKYIPSIEDMANVGDLCEEKHRYCRLIY